MAARLVQVFLPESQVGRLDEILARHCRRYWREDVPSDQEKFSAIVQQRYTERLIEDLEGAFGHLAGFSAYVASLEAVIPPVDETPESELPLVEASRPPTALERFFSRDRLSTSELFDDIEESLHISPSYLATALLSAIIAALGMRSGQTAVVIGAMIIAPLLGPTIGIALATTIGDARIGVRAVRTLLFGIAMATAGGLLVGWSVPIDPAVPELHNRTIVHPADIALALACGTAGVLAFSRGGSLTLVGVMIAVALVPPLAAFGIYSAIGDFASALRAFYLFAVNLVCLNVAGIATLLLQGLPPKDWRMTGGIMALWLFVLVAMASLLVGRVALGLD